tara:strand:+ start:140 stop:1462 length:1323 start_codon:yes stop_codon:yes gene_type:complete
MGADQNLIRAASRMGEKPWDYSGIIKAIQAIGVYTNKKRAIANEISSYGSKLTNIKAVPDEIFQGQYGDQNMDFMTTAKQEWNNATNIIKNPLNIPSSKKYKTAVKTINNIRSVLENNKAGLIKWEEIRSDIQNKRAKMSKGTEFFAENRILDIVNNEADANINNNLVFTNEGLMYYDSNQNELVSISDLTNGYKENFVDDKLSKRITGIIEKYTKKTSEDDEFQKSDFSAEMLGVFNELKTNKDSGFDRLRSLAYDYQFPLISGVPASYVQANSEDLLKLTNEQWIAANPNYTNDELETMKEQTLASLYGANNLKDLEVNMLEWFVNSTEAKFTASDPKKTSSDRTSVMLPIARRLYFEDETRLASIMEGKSGGKNRTFNIQDITFDYVDNKWRSNFNGTMLPVEGNNQNVKDGSGEALFNQLGQREAFKFLLLPTYNK